MLHPSPAPETILDHHTPLSSCKCRSSLPAKSRQHTSVAGQPASANILDGSLFFSCFLISSTSVGHFECYDHLLQSQVSHQVVFWVLLATEVALVESTIAPRHAQLALTLESTGEKHSARRQGKSLLELSQPQQRGKKSQR